MNGFREPSQRKTLNSPGALAGVDTQIGWYHPENMETVELPVECESLEALPVLTDHVEMKTWPASFALRFDVR